jgi:hypothetical protein
VVLLQNNKTKTIKTKNKMKRRVGLIIATIVSIILLMTQNSFAQCDTKTIRKSVNFSLDEYIYESLAFKSYNEFEKKDAVQATFSVFKNEQYRIVDVCEGFEGRVIINLYDSKNRLFISNVYMGDAKVFDFTAKYSGDYTIEYIFDKKDIKNPNNKCVAFGLGYK